MQKIDLRIPPFRVQSIDFITVSISCKKPFVIVAPIKDLDSMAIEGDNLKKISIKVRHQYFEENIVLRGKPTPRNIIMHIRECYRVIYRQARNLGVRGEMTSLRSLVVSHISMQKEENGEIVIEPFVFDPPPL